VRYRWFRGGCGFGVKYRIFDFRGGLAFRPPVLNAPTESRFVQQATYCPLSQVLNTPYSTALEDAA
jgi:hypothetical protein